jgi:hypothetical protein
LNKRVFKLIAATLTALGAVLTILDWIFPPVYIEWHSSPKYPDFLRLLGSIFFLLPALIYIALDWKNLFPKRDKKGVNRIEMRDLDQGEHAQPGRKDLP